MPADALCTFVSSVVKRSDMKDTKADNAPSNNTARDPEIVGCLGIEIYL